MNRIVKSTSTSGDGSGGSRTRSSYSTGRNNSPSRRSSKRSGGGGGGSSKKKKKFKKFQQRDHAKKDDRRDTAKKDEKGEDKPLHFAAAFAQGVFSFLALTMLARAGLAVTNALTVAASPKSGLTSTGRRYGLVTSAWTSLCHRGIMCSCLWTA